MKTIEQYFDAGVQKAGNDTELAKALEISQAATSRYRSGQRVPDATTAAKLAIYLGIKEFEVIAAAELARAKTAKARKLWDTLGKRWAATGVIVLTAGLLAAYNTEHNEIVAKLATNPALFLSIASTTDLYYVKLLVMTLLFATLQFSLQSTNLRRVIFSARHSQKPMQGIQRLAA